MKNRILLTLSVIIVLVCKSLPSSAPNPRLVDYESRTSSLNVNLTAREKKLYEGCPVVKRQYRLDNATATVLIVDAADNPHAIHKPAFCLRSAGWEISEGTFALPRGSAGKLVATQGERKEEVLFWFTEPQEQYTKVLRFRWRSTLRQFLPSHSSSGPLYVVVASRGDMKWTRFMAAFPELAEL